MPQPTRGDAHKSLLTGHPWSQAIGLQRVRPGFCFEPDEDALLALGWPHLALIVDDDDPQHPPVPVRRVLRQLYFKRRIRWQRTAAIRLTRAWGQPVLFARALDEDHLHETVAAALEQREPISNREADLLVETRMTRTTAGMSEQSIESFCMLLEAQIGPLRLVKSMTELLEDMTTEQLWIRWTLPSWFTFQLGYLLERLTRDQSQNFKPRLRNVLERALSAADPRPWSDRQSSHARSLHLVLNGGRAAVESTDGDPRWYTHIHDDSELISRRIGRVASVVEPDAHMVFLGGLRVLRQYGRDWRKKLATLDAQEWFIEQMGPINAPETLALMLAMRRGSLVRGTAAAWFHTRSEAVVPMLTEAAKGDGELALAAQDTLRELEKRRSG